MLEEEKMDASCLVNLLLHKQGTQLIYVCAYVKCTHAKRYRKPHPVKYPGGYWGTSG